MSESTYNDVLSQLRVFSAKRSSKVEPKELVRLAKENSLGIKETLRAIREFCEPGFRPQESGNMYDALNIFISTISSHEEYKRILEYNSSPNLYTASAFEDIDCEHSAFVAQNSDLRDALQVLFDNKHAVFYEDIVELPQTETFDLIVSFPPIGQVKPIKDGSDVFGGEIIISLSKYLANDGRLCWITTRGALFQSKVGKNLSLLKQQGFQVTAIIEVASGALPGTSLKSVVIILQRSTLSHRFVGILRDIESAEQLAKYFLKGPIRKPAAFGEWIDITDSRSFSVIEQERLLKKSIPRGSHSITVFRELLLDELIEKADTPVPEEFRDAEFIFIPEYVSGRVTTNMEEQTEKPNIVWRVPIDTSKVSARFLEYLLNSVYGKQLRLSIVGQTIQQVRINNLLDSEVAIPSVEIQKKIVQINGDIGLLRASMDEMQSNLEKDWSNLSEPIENLDRLKSVLDIEIQIREWWRELPYPLATIYRRYQVETDPKERFETLLHFFEMSSVYLASVGASFIKSLHPEWQDVLAKLFRPVGVAGIESPGFGFWSSFARSSLKEVRRIVSDIEIRLRAIDRAGPELVENASFICQLGQGANPLNVARQYRNAWKGHGGLIKPSDAEKLESELQPSIKNFYETTSAVFRRFHLIRTGLAEITDGCIKYQIEKLCGSDPMFEKAHIEIDRVANSNSLAFWVSGARSVSRVVPFFRLGVPQQPQETNVYVFNRVEKESFRWICFQEAKEQECFAPDDDLRGLIDLGKVTK